MNNPAHFQQMMGSAGAGPPRMQRQPPDTAQVSQHIVKLLQQASVPSSGWQSTFRIEERYGWVNQVITNIRLLKSDADVFQAIKVAISFERQTFTQSQSAEQYVAAFKEKLDQITQNRQKNVLQQANGMQNPQMVMMQQAVAQAARPSPAQNGFPQGFPPQLQHQMQASPIPPLPPNTASMGMNNSNLQATMLANQPAQQGVLPPGTHLTPAENGNINRLAQQMVQNTPIETLNMLRKTVIEKMTPQQRQSFHNQNMDPVLQHFRRAAGRLLQAKAQQQQQARSAALQVGQGQEPGAVLGGMRPQTAMSQRSAQQPQTTQGQPGGQEFDPTQFLGQQAEGLRSQDAGQLVVPASNNVNPQLGNFSQAGVPQIPNQTMGVPGQMANPMAQRQQQFLNAQQAQRDQGLRVSQMQANVQNQALNVAQAQAHANSLRGQPGGMNASQPTLQSPAMSMLNRPMGPSGQPPNVTPQQRAQQRVPQMAQHSPAQADAQLAAQAQQQAQQRMAAAQGQQFGIRNNSLQIPAHYPTSMKQQLANLPDQAVRDLLAKFNSNNPSNQFAQYSQTGQQINPQPMQNGQLANVSMNAPGSNLPSGIQQGHQQGPGVPVNPQMALQQRMLHQQAMQMRQMDLGPFPPHLLSQSVFQSLPEDVKTWGQLKEWTQQNPTLPEGTVDKLRQYQQLQLNQFRNHAQNAQAQQNAPPVSNGGPRPAQQPGGQAPQAQMVPSGNSQAQMQPRMGMQQGQLGELPFSPPTLQEIQQVRARLPQLQNAPDDAIRAMINKQKLSQLQKMDPAAFQRYVAYNAALRQQQQAAMRQAQQQSQQPPQNQVMQPGQPQAQQQRLQQPNQPSQPPPPSKLAQPPPPSKSARPPQATQQPGPPPQAAPSTLVVQQGQKGQKRPNNDDVVEIANPNITPPKAQQATKMQATSSQQRPMNLTAQQLSQLTPEQRQAALRAQAMQRGPSQNQIQSQNQNQNQQPQRLQPPQALQVPANDPAVVERARQKALQNQKMRSIYAEMAAKTPKDPLVQIPDNVKDQMAVKLRSFLPQIVMLEKYMGSYFQIMDDENVLREMVQLRFLLGHQMRKDGSVKDYWSIGPDALDATMRKVANLLRLFQVKANEAQRKAAMHAQLAAGISQQQQQPQQPNAPLQQPQQQQQQVQEGATSAAPTSQPQLSAANLQQQQHALEVVRNNSLHRRQNSRPPAAPTTAQPLFAVGAASPQGIPVYGSNELTVDKLKFPPQKKRKPNGQQGGSAVSTPANQITPGSIASPNVGKIATPELKRVQPKEEVKPTFRCEDMDCESSINGFLTQTELDRHKEDEHKKIEDPFAYVLEVMAAAQGLDKDGNRKPVKVEAKPTAPAVAKPQPPAAAQPTAAQIQMTKVKQEANTPTPAAAAVGTPMNRILSQQAGIKASPSGSANNLLKTPSKPVGKVQTPGSGATISTPAKKFQPPVKAGPTPKVPTLNDSAPQQEPEDPWATSLISQAQILEAFSGILDDVPGTSTEMFALRPEPSPAESSNSTEARESDVSETDKLDIFFDWDAFPSLEDSTGLGGGLSTDLAQGLSLADEGQDVLAMLDAYGAERNEREGGAAAPAAEVLDDDDMDVSVTHTTSAESQEEEKKAKDKDEETKEGKDDTTATAMDWTDDTDSLFGDGLLADELFATERSGLDAWDDDGHGRSVFAGMFT
ncbi:hypothetical protein BJ546DRAFT_954331 [Cryomyces antarcticus]